MNTKTTSRLASGTKTTSTSQAQLERMILAAITRRPAWEMGRITDPVNGFVHAVLRDGEFTATVGRTPSQHLWTWQVQRNGQVLSGGQVVPSGPTANMRAAEKVIAEHTVHPDQKTADEIASGLRQLADMVAAHPELADEMRHDFKRILVPLSQEDRSAARLAQYIRAAKEFGATVTKDASESWFGVELSFGRVSIRPYAAREEVCERVVVGSREVTEEVPDPKLLAAVPTTTVTRTEDIVEWQCKPLLAAEAVQE